MSDNRYYVNFLHVVERPEVVHLKLTSREKETISAAAETNGFRSLATYIRWLAVHGAKETLKERNYRGPRLDP